MRPDLTLAVVGSAIPYIPFAGPFRPTSALAPYFPHLSYQIFLGETPVLAQAELDHDIRRSLRATLRGMASPPPKAYLTHTDSFLRAYEDIAEVCCLCVR